MLLQSPGYCDNHRKAVYKQQKQTVNFDYAERNRFYQRKEWKQVRAWQLAREPLCRHCKRGHRMVEATHVDHIVAIEDGGHKTDPSNLQSLCKPCHERKTGLDRHA